jgi:hypothetical protein
MKFSKGKSGNPGGRPKVLGEVQELARHHAPEVIAELARLAVKARSETARIAAGRELLDRGFGRARQSLEVSHPGENIVRMLLDDIDARNRENDRLNATKWKQFGNGAPSSS